MRYEGYDKGAAQFVRGEGLCYHNGEFYFTATSGGEKRLGQIWRYRPGRTAADGGTIELFVESPGKEVLDYPDNLTMAPWGDLICCEDGDDAINRLIGITPKESYTPLRAMPSMIKNWRGFASHPTAKPCLSISTIRG